MVTHGIAKLFAKNNSAKYNLITAVCLITVGIYCSYLHIGVREVSAKQQSEVAKRTAVPEAGLKTKSLNGKGLKMMTVKDVIKKVETKAGHSLQIDEGMRFGGVNDKVKGITVCWMATPEAINSAAEKGHSLILCHEALTFPLPALTQTTERQYLSWPVNRQRLDLLAKNNIAVCRMHGTIDELFIYDAFCEMVGATEIKAQQPGYQMKIFSIEPIRYADLIEKVKSATSLKNLRATAGDPDRIVKTVGLPWGGLGLLPNVGYMQALIDLGDIDVMIAGETENYGFRFCKEIGIDMIETSHEISENPGLAKFTEWLKIQYPDIDIAFYENPLIWTVY